jgi:hypothetical protein
VVGARYRPWLGVLLSSALFSVLHFLNPNLNPIAALNIALIGVVFALYALWEGGIWGACGMHAAWNWAQGNLFGFEVSGNRISTATLLNLQETGPGLFTGDAFGPEAGLAATLVTLAAAAAFALVLGRTAWKKGEHEGVPPS